MYSLRTRRLLSNHRTRGRVGAFAIDRNGVLLYTEAPDGDKPFVGSNRTFGLVPDGLFPDFLHYASATVAWRDPYGIHTWQVRGGSKEAGTLYRSGDVRVVASNLELYLRAPGLDKRIGYPFLDCPGSGGCDGIDTIQVAGRYAGVEWAGFDRYDSFGTLTIYDTATGKRSYPCGASHKTDDRVETFVLTPQGKVACVRVVNQIPRVVSDGVVLDEGKGIDEDSLARRGDQIVWRHDGLQRTAPLPTASG